MSPKPETTIQRAWLYEQIWQQPATRIAKELGISSSALKRICDCMKIPTPPAGHWAKVEAGHVVPSPALPAADKDTKTSWSIGIANSLAQKATKQRDDSNQKAVEEMPEVKTSTDLDNLHALVKSTRAQLREDVKKLSWDKRKNRRRLNCNVSEPMIDRACLILDTIVKETEAMGFAFRCELDEHDASKSSSRYTDSYHRNEPSGICWIQAGDQRIQMSLRERNRRVYFPEEKKTWYSNYEEVPSGLLEFNLHEQYSYQGRTSWNDGKVQRIETLIPLIIAEIPKIAAAKKAEQERQERREKLWKHQEEVRRFQEKRRKLNLEAFDAFMNEATNYRSALMAKEYLDAVKRKHGINSESDLPSVVTAWLEWTKKYISILDPASTSTPPWERKAFSDLLENSIQEPPEPPDDI